MLNKILLTVIPILVKTKYLVLSIKIKFTNLIHSKKNKSAIKKLYELYILKVANGEIFPQSSHNSGAIFPEFRVQNNGILKEEEEDFLIKLLSRNTSKWFVPHVLNYMDSFSRKMMRNLIETAIKVKDPSYNNCFLRPAIRVYDLEVNDYLVEKFPNSSIDHKAGILRSFYWVQSRIINCTYPNGIKDTYVANYEWEDNILKETSRMNHIEFQNYKNLANQKRNERNALLLEEYFKIENKKLKESISWYLPKESNKYQENNKFLANQYLSEIEK